MSELQASVVVPVFNGGEALQRCLQALSEQDFTGLFEVVVVDDGSTEDLTPIRQGWMNALAVPPPVSERSPQGEEKPSSSQVATMTHVPEPRPGLPPHQMPDSSFQGTHPRKPVNMTLQWLTLPQNRGPAVARNAGIEAARAQIVCFTDADCIPVVSWLTALIAPFADPGVTGTKGTYRTQQQDRWARLAQIEFAERYALLASHTDIDFIDTYSGAYRRHDLLAVKGFDESFPNPDNEDVDLSFRIKAQGGRFVFVPDAVVIHRHREGWRAYAALKVRRGFWRWQVYRRHPGKTGSDTYTPWTMKAQFLLLLALPIALVAPRRALPAWAAGWGITCLDLSRHAWRTDRALLPLIPLLPLVRGLAILAGTAIAAGAALTEGPPGWLSKARPGAPARCPSEMSR